MTAGTYSKTATHCPYCALQCGVLVDRGPADRPTELSLVGNRDFPVNAGALCIKGWTATEVVNHPDRLDGPLARDESGALVPVSWREALDRAAAAMRRTQKQHGRDAVGVLGSGALTNEKAYLLGKFARVALRTRHIDYNGRFCMSSASAASMRAFGLDRGLPFPLEDLADAEVILLVGGNPAETMPPLMRYFDAQRRAGGTLIVVDPRRSATAQLASLHLSPQPGTDAALANGLLHLLVRDGRVNHEYIASRTEGFAKLAGILNCYWPEQVERVTGIPEAQLLRAASILGKARSAIVLTGRGPEQQAQGVNNTLAFINLALALGLPGTAGSGYGCLTGQGNGQGGREHGQKADQLPGCRRIDDADAREHVAAIWGVSERTIPGPGMSAGEMLASLGRPEGVRTLFVMGFNPVVSAPDALEVEAGLRRLDHLIVTDFFLSETAQLADIVLPAAQWAEEDGTMTNLEGRVIRRRRAVPPPMRIRTDLGIIAGLAERLGQGERLTFDRPEAVFDELARASRGGLADYSGISYEKIDALGGVFWPCPSTDHPGTPRLFLDRFATPSGRARFHPVRHQPPAETPDRAFPLFLTTGRVLAHYQSGTMTRRVPRLNAAAGVPVVELHPRAAARHGIAAGDRVHVETRRGAASFLARVTRDIQPDTMFVPFHWPAEQSANRLTNPALDPVSRMPEFKVCAASVRKAPAPED